MPMGKMFKFKPRPRKTATVKQVKRMIIARSDKIHSETGPVAPAAMGVAGTITSLRNATQDSKILRLNIRNRFNLPYVAGQTSCSVRHILFQWADDSVPTVTDVLKDVSYLSQLEFDKSGGRVKLLYDRTFELQETTKPSHTYILNVPPSRLNMLHYDTGLTTGRGVIYQLTISDSATVTFAYSRGDELIYV